ncbi:MAG: hypothetical protein H6821_06660 [Planctomycetaceae bacterium]|nr:hypothetical protein [Planctomycetales bacterium]MCB9873845.1 hypothetical protein [Planctomycetaceae bacterium]MCB9941453.1 hypothetical protein [Planctomycetaceae bacterium]HRX78501.1 hypothetical protein [Pirellulaceae bacterium]
MNPFLANSSSRLLRLLRLFGLYDKGSLAIRLQTVLVTKDGTICQRVACSHSFTP